MRAAIAAFTLIAWMQSAYAACTLQSSVEGMIGPATVDLFHRMQKRVEADACQSLFLTVNTPGGDLESTHEIVEQILNFPVPVLCLVGPAGAHAGSAGAIILQACHVNGGIRGTNLGAATPISETGEDIPKDLRRKILNDTQSWLQSVVNLRGRSLKFAQDIILEAKSVSAEEAKRLNAIDAVVESNPQFLAFANGRHVKMAEGKPNVVETGPVIKMDLDVRFQVLQIVTDPEIAYIIFLASLALIYFEFTHPGAFVAGVSGAIGLIIALISMHKLQVEWGGLALIVLGIGLLITELFVSSFGAFGIGGVTAFVLGSLFLFDPVKTGGYRLPLMLIMPMAVTFAAIILALGFLMLRTRRLVKKGGFDELFGAAGRVVKIENDIATRGLIEIHGEIWSFVSPAPLRAGARVRVVGHDKLILHVQPDTESL